MSADQAALNDSANPIEQEFSIEPKVMSVLCLLAEQQGRVVDRLALLDKAWDNQDITDENLTRAISILRRTFRRFTADPVIETISKRGYRLIPEIRYQSAKTPETAGPPTSVIVVLPFNNLSLDQADSFLVTGISQDLASLLSRIPELRVVPPTTAEQIARRLMVAPEAAQELNIDYLVSGQLERRGNTFRLRAELANAATNRLMWSTNFDENVDTFFKVQDQLVDGIATALSTELRATLSQALAMRPDFSLNAYEHIQIAEEARRFYNKESAEQVVLHLRKSLSIQPDNAEAHACLAEQYSQNLVSQYSDDPVRDAELMALHLKRSQALAPGDPKVLRASGVVSVMSGNYIEARTALEMSLQGNPSDPHVQGLFGLSVGMLEDPVRGIRLLETAEKSAATHPRSSMWAHYRALLLFHFLEDRAAGLQAISIAIQRNPVFHTHYITHAHMQAYLGDWDAMTRSLREGLEQAPNMTPGQYQNGSTRFGFSFLFDSPVWDRMKTVWEDELSRPELD